MNKFTYSKEMLGKALRAFSKENGRPFSWKLDRDNISMRVFAEEVAAQSRDEAEIAAECPECGYTVGCVNESELCPVCINRVFCEARFEVSRPAIVSVMIPLTYKGKALTHDLIKAVVHRAYEDACANSMVTITAEEFEK